jgi:histidyl-tRNA synthetase
VNQELETNTKQEKKKIEKLSVQGYRGTRDIYPDEMRERKWVYKHIHDVMQQFGYEEYGGPFVEHLELYASKTSEEIVREQLYSFVDRGERTIAIRPEMTPTLARMVAAKMNQLTRPIRWYSIPTCMRYERPQRGRLREFDQLNVDVFGGLALDEDVEIILTISALMKRLGGIDGSYSILLNHRGLMNDFFTVRLGLDPEKSMQLFRLIDRLKKLSPDAFSGELESLGITGPKRDLLDEYLSCKGTDFISSDGAFSEHAEPFISLLSILQKLLPGECLYDPTVMRGFDYYTGTVFEVFDNHPDNRRALMGGGRYENLVSSFGVTPLAGIGYGVSDVMLLNFVESHKLLPELQKNIDVSVLRFSEDDRLEMLSVASRLRELGLNVDMNITASKLGKQIQTAEKNGSRAVVFQGEEEKRRDVLSVKVLKTGVQKEIEVSCLEKIMDILKENV